MPNRSRRKWLWLVAAAALTAPWWIPNTPWVKHWLATQINERTGLECRLGLIVPMAWNGRAHLHGLQLRRPGQPQPLVDLPHLTADIRWSAFKRGRLEITRLHIDGGQLYWSPAPTPGDPTQTDALDTAETEVTTDEPTDWAATDLPSARQATERTSAPGATGLLGAEEAVAAAGPDRPPLASPDDATATLPSSPGSVAANASAVADAAATADSTATGPTDAPQAPSGSTPGSRQGRRWHLGRVQVSALQVRWFRTSAPDAPEVASTSVDLDIPLAEAPAATDRSGRLRGSAMRLAGRAWPTVVEIPLLWDGHVLQIREADVPVPGGSVRVSAAMVPGAPGWPLTGEASGTGVRIDALSKWVAPESVAATGFGEGALRFAVPVRRPGRLRTVGQVRLTHLVLPVSVWLEQASMPGLAARWPTPQWAARSATLQFSSTAGQLSVDDATLASDELTVRALGTATAGGGPSLAIRTYVPPGGADVLTQLSASWSPNRQLRPQPLPNSPWAFLDLGIQGSWARPEIVLWDRAWLLPDLQSEIRRLQGPAPPS